MNRPRYEPVSQQDEVIILDNISATHNYNYNTGIPSSIASSIAGSTISRNQTPTPIYTPSASSSNPSYNPSSSYNPTNPYSRSPPPSFHTLSSPGTPRPGRAQSIRTTHSGNTLWGVAPSTVGGGETELDTEEGRTEGGRSIGTSNDALATIARLRTRVEWLEESIGRLLIEKDALFASQITQSNLDPAEGARDNCCVTFTSTTPDMERALAGRRNNCCVTFRSSAAVERRSRAVTAVKLVLFALIVMFVTLGISGRGGGGGGRDNIRIGDVNGKGIETTTSELEHNKH